MPAQQIITTFAGTEWVFPGNGRPAANAPLSSGLNTAVDRQGRLVIADALNHVVMRVEASGVVTVIAGNGVSGFSGDGGEAVRASLNRPEGIVYDAAGNLYIADFSNRRVRRVSPSGIITTYAGRGTSAFSGDGGAATAAGMTPLRLAMDAAGALYLTDTDGRRVRKVGTDGIITTVAGNGEMSFPGAGRAARDTGMVPEAIAIDSAGRLLISDSENYRVLRVGNDGLVTLIAGTGQRAFSGDGGPAAQAATTNVNALTSDAAGNIYLADTSNRRVRRITTAGVITTIAGGSTAVVTAAGVDALQADLGFPES